MSKTKYQIEIPGIIIRNVFGTLDVNLKKIEEAFMVSIVNYDTTVRIFANHGTPASKPDKAQAVLEHLRAVAAKGDIISDHHVGYAIATIQAAEDGGAMREIANLSDNIVCKTASGVFLKPKTVGQKEYVEQMRNNTVVFAIGPAGTGKTYLAMAMAIEAFRQKTVTRIILTRPAIEAGENLGFLPGDLQQKVDPYLRPLYDALHNIMGPEAFEQNVERNLIEVAPLAYMRGRTLDKSFIVLDEAQNTTPEQMKMFLTRLGNGSRAVITGDVTQIDLPAGKRSGLEEAANILGVIPEIGVSRLQRADVVRHPLVQKIIDVYDGQIGTQEEIAA